MRGRIKTAWRIENGEFVLDVRVPVGVQAVVMRPGDKKATEVIGVKQQFRRKWKG